MMQIIPYEEKFGAIRFPEGFEEKLAGKTLEEQMNFYRITESSTLARTSYGEIDSERVTKNTFALSDYSRFLGLIVRDGLIVGVMIEDFFFHRSCPCLPYGRVCVYYASDNEGSGTKDREDCAYLICV